MKDEVKTPGRQDGFSLLETVTVMAIIGALIMIGLPSYLRQRDQAKAMACLANRYQAETAEASQYLTNGTPGLAIEERFGCPSGGELIWIISDPKDPGYPRLGCSIHYFPADTLQPATTPLFASDFATMEGLSPLTGKWDVQSGALVNKSQGESRLAFGQKDWTDYTLTVNATLTSGDGYGIYYRSDGRPDITGYVFQYDPGFGSGEFIVRKVANGQEQSPFQRVPIPKGFTVYNTSHQIAVSVVGNQHTIQIDGATVLSFTDDAYTSGMGGLRTWTKSQAIFEDVSVTAAGK